MDADAVNLSPDNGQPTQLTLPNTAGLEDHLGYDPANIDPSKGMTEDQYASARGAPDATAPLTEGQYMESLKARGVRPQDVNKENPDLAYKMWSEDPIGPKNWGDAMRYGWIAARSPVWDIPQAALRGMKDAGQAGYSLVKNLYNLSGGLDTEDPESQKRAEGAIQNLKGAGISFLSDVNHMANSAESNLMGMLVRAGIRKTEDPLTKAEVNRILDSLNSSEKTQQDIQHADLPDAAKDLYSAWANKNITPDTMEKIKNVFGGFTPEELQSMGYDPDEAQKMAMLPWFAIPVSKFVPDDIAGPLSEGMLKASSMPFRGAEAAMGSTGIQRLLYHTPMYYGIYAAAHGNFEPLAIGLGIRVAGPYAAKAMQVGSGMAGSMADFLSEAGTRAGLSPAEAAMLQQLEAMSGTSPNFAQRAMLGMAQGAAHGMSQMAPFTVSAQSPEEAAQTLGTGAGIGAAGAAGHEAYNLAAATALAGRKTMFDSAVKTPQGVYLPLSTESLVYNEPEMDAMHEQDIGGWKPENIDDLNRQRHLMQGAARIYTMPAATFDAAPFAQGIDGAYGVRMKSNTGPDYLIYRGEEGFENAKSHEPVHVVRDGLSENERSSLDKSLLQINDPSAFATQYYSRLSGKPVQVDFNKLPAKIADPNDPLGMTKENVMSEMTVDALKNMDISKITSDPGLKRKLQLGIGKALEAIGIPTTTPEIQSITGVTPSMTAISILENAVRRMGVSAGEGVTYGQQPSPPAVAPTQETQPSTPMALPEHATPSVIQAPAFDPHVHFPKVVSALRALGFKATDAKAKAEESILEAKALNMPVTPEAIVAHTLSGKWPEEVTRAKMVTSPEDVQVANQPEPAPEPVPTAQPEQVPVSPQDLTQAWKQNFMEERPDALGAKDWQFMPREVANPEVSKAADDYMKSVRGIDRVPHREYVPVQAGLSKKLADYYDSTPHKPYDAAVKKAYTAFKYETADQWRTAVKHGFKFEPWEEKGQPYYNSKEMMDDIINNKHLYYYKTEKGFGSLTESGQRGYEHPMLDSSGLHDINGKLMPINDVFRAVHDLYGHGEMGWQFGPKGEFNAALSHARMYSAAAKPAMLWETQAQNAWVNYGKHLRDAEGKVPEKGEPGYVPLQDRPIAEQKANILTPELVKDIAGEERATHEAETKWDNLPKQSKQKIAQKLGLDDIASMHEDYHELPIHGQQALRDYSSQFMPSGHSNAIDKPAIQTEDGFTFAAPSHMHAAMAAKSFGVSQDAINRAIKGFVTKKGEFMDTQRAQQHAEEIGQMPESLKDRLSPEDFSMQRSFMPQEQPKTPSGMDVEEARDRVAKSRYGKPYSELDEPYKKTVDEIAHIPKDLRAGKLPSEKPINPSPNYGGSEMPREYGPSSGTSYMPFYSQLERTIDNQPDKSNPDQLRAAIMSGSKKAEREGIKDTLGTSFSQYLQDNPKATKQQMLDFVRENQVQVKEISTTGRPKPQMNPADDALWRKHLSGEPLTDKEQEKIDELRIPNVKYGPDTHPNMSLPGGTDYRETLVTLPKKLTPAEAESPRPAMFTSSHWDEPNVVLHLRHNMRDFDGPLADEGGAFGHGKMFFLEELQSDWAQKGRKEGYATPKINASSAKRIPELDEYNATAWEVTFPDGSKENIYADNEQEAIKTAESEYNTESTKGGIPDLPFKGNAWKTLGLKIALRKAVESGANELGWTTGEQQAERYDLGKHVDKLVVDKVGEDSWDITGLKDGAEVITKDGLPARELQNFIGKDLSERAIREKGGHYEGLDLKVGVEGMKGFYDKELVNLANDLVKKWGVKVGEAKLKTTPEEFLDAGPEDQDYSIVHSIPINDTMRRDILENGQPLFMPKNTPGQFQDMAEHHGLIYNGEYPEGEPKMHLFTDRGTKSTIAVPLNATAEDLNNKVRDSRSKYINDVWLKDYPRPQFMPSNHPDAIKEAAVKANDGKIFTGRIHIEALHKALDQGYDGYHPFEYGYVDNHDNFWNNEQAMQIASDIGQVSIPNYNQKHEDILDEPAHGHLDSIVFDSVRQFMPSKTMLNIGLKKQDGSIMHPEEAISALMGMGAKVVNSSVQQSNTEPTLVATISKPLSEEDAHTLSEGLDQQSIAQLHKGKGELYGPGAEEWRPFNPEYFMMHEGNTLEDQQRDQWGEVYNHLTPEEKSSVQDRNIQRVLKVYRDFSLEEGADKALKGQEKKTWYQDAYHALSDIFGPDTDRFASLLAALSPQVDVSTNLMNALKTWNEWVGKGRPTDRDTIENIVANNIMADEKKGEKPALGAWTGNSWRALSAENPQEIKLSGPKVNSFAQNLRNNLNEVTNDRWMKYYAYGVRNLPFGRRIQGGMEIPGFDYLAMNAHIREVADYLTKTTGEKWTPAEAQAAIWSYSKTIAEVAESKGVTPQELLTGKQVDKLPISATVDFASLLHEPRYQSHVQKTRNAAGTAKGHVQELSEVPGLGEAEIPASHVGIGEEVNPF
jgi:hypothetical protein